MVSLYPWALCDTVSYTHCELVHDIFQLGDHDPLYAYLSDRNVLPHMRHFVARSNSSS